MVIYVVTNKINRKQYVGQTTQSLSSRWHQHKRSKIGCRALKSSISKYGPEAFEIVELAKAVDQEELNNLEIQFINDLNTMAPNGYNLKSGGRTNIVYSDQSRKKMSESHKGKKNSPEATAKTAAALTGSGNGNYGKKFSHEHKTKLSLAHLGNTSRAKIKISCDQTKKAFVSISVAAKAMGLSMSCLSKHVRGLKKNVKGFTFSRVE